MIYYTFIGQLTEFFGIMVTVFGLAFLVSIFVEASFINLERWIFSSAAPSKGVYDVSITEWGNFPEIFLLFLYLKSGKNKGSEETDANAIKAADETKAEDVENNGGNVNAAFNPEESATEKQFGTKL